jgi:hypothetical protein
MKTLVKFLKALYLSCMIGLLAISVYGQTDSSVLEKLKKTWEMQGMTDKTADDKYVNDKIIHHLNGQHFANEEYYLSDSIVTAFDPNKVGKIFNGRYIVSRVLPGKKNTNPVPVNVLEIIELDNDKLILKNIKRPHILLEYKAK